MKFYRVRNWESLFETYETKKLIHLRWIPVPNKHDGKSFRRISMMKNACEIFTGWMLILQVASKCNPRGSLIDGEEPITSEDLSIMTGFPHAVFTAALAVLSNGKIDWLEVVDNQSSPASPADPAVLTAESPEEGRKEGIEGNERIEGRKGIVEEIVSMWNSIEGLPRVLSVTDRRKKAFKARMEDKFFASNWKEGLERLKVSSFCTGTNDRGWKADFDWFIKPDSMTKIMEGKYDDKEKKASTVLNTTLTREQRDAEFLERKRLEEERGAQL